MPAGAWYVKSVSQMSNAPSLSMTNMYACLPLSQCFATISDKLITVATVISKEKNKQRLFLFLL